MSNFYILKKVWSYLLFMFVLLISMLNFCYATSANIALDMMQNEDPGIDSSCEYIRDDDIDAVGRVTFEVHNMLSLDKQKQLYIERDPNYDDVELYLIDHDGHKRHFHPQILPYGKKITLVSNLETLGMFGSIKHQEDSNMFSSIGIYPTKQIDTTRGATKWVTINDILNDEFKINIDIHPQFKGNSTCLTGFKIIYRDNHYGINKDQDKE